MLGIRVRSHVVVNLKAELVLVEVAWGVGQ